MCGDDDGDFACLHDLHQVLPDPGEETETAEMLQGSSTGCPHGCYHHGNRTQAMQRDSLSPEDRVHPNCGLIQDEKFWILKERRSQRHPPLLTTAANSNNKRQNIQDPKTASAMFILWLMRQLISRQAFRGGWVGTNLTDNTVENNSTSENVVWNHGTRLTASLGLVIEQS